MMPSSSPKQARLMRVVAHGWKPPVSSGIEVPVSVAKEFEVADAKKPNALAKQRRLARAMGPR